MKFKVALREEVGIRGTLQYQKLQLQSVTRLDNVYVNRHRRSVFLLRRRCNRFSHIEADTMLAYLRNLCPNFRRVAIRPSTLSTTRGFIRRSPWTCLLTVPNSCANYSPQDDRTYQWQRHRLPATTTLKPETLTSADRVGPSRPIFGLGPGPDSGVFTARPSAISKQVSNTVPNSCASCPRQDVAVAAAAPVVFPRPAMARMG